MVVFRRWKLLAKLEQLSALAGVAVATAVAASVAAAAVFKTFLEILSLSSKLVIALPPWFCASSHGHVDSGHVGAADRSLLVLVLVLREREREREREL